MVCWPFNGSYNQALLCVFDGHGSKGEQASLLLTTYYLLLYYLLLTTTTCYLLLTTYYLLSTIGY